MRRKSFSELRELDGQPLALAAKPGPFGRVRDLTLQAGEVIRFTTPHIDARGTVLSIDHGAVYPVEVEWFNASGDKRVTSFQPAEFISIVKES